MTQEEDKKRRETSMKNLIGYEWKEASDGNKIEVVNPATSELIDTVPNVTEEDVNKAVEVAEIEQKKWAEVPIHERADKLYKFVDLIEENKERLAQLLTAETGKPIKEARGEIANVRIGVKAFIERAKHLYGESIPAGQEAGQEKTMQITKRYPIGVIAAIIPFNFPSDLFCQKVPPALLMGNSIIVKPSNYNPLTLIEYVKLMIEAGVPAGCIQILTGDGPKVGQALARHPGVHLVSLTGGTAAGIQTMGTCSQNLTHVMLELGGNDAFIFLEDGDMDLAIKETIWGRLYNGGQVCCASKRFLIHNSRKTEFIEKMKEVISNLKVGDPTKEDTDMGPMININAAKRIEEQVNKTVAEGAKIVCGGKREDAYYYPTILDNVTKDMEVAKDMEIFGPVISVIGFDTVEEAIEIANQSSYGLCGCVITKDYSLGMKVADKLECGGAIVNGASFYRSFEMPFGGWKHSGIGNEGVLTTLQEMSKIKTIILKNIL
jgi:acyl-CoA reductase-like NAD-dependent aldehyde dehydrogenase